MPCMANTTTMKEPQILLLAYSAMMVVETGKWTIPTNAKHRFPVLPKDYPLISLTGYIELRKLFLTRTPQWDCQRDISSNRLNKSHVKQNQ